jgi:uncharacterized delta-60 repeat protein
MKKIFMLLAAVLIMVITGCGSGSNSDSTPTPAASEKTDTATVTVSPSLSGSLDTTFGTGGIVTTPIGSYDAYAYALGIGSDGRIVAAGYSSNGSNYDFAIVRYNTNGSLDTTFGTGGIVTTPVGSGNAIANALGIQSDGNILAAGSSYNGSNYNFALVRYNTNGSLDTTFGTGGIVTTPIGSYDAYAYALAIQSDGRIVVAGYSSNGSNYNFALVRYNTNGSLDTTFGTGGIVTTPMGSGYDIAYALAIQSDGSILAAGSSYNGSNYDFAIVRYNTNGSLDTTFGTGGIVTTSIGTGDSEALALGIGSDGMILTAGKSYNGSNYDFALARYNTNGSLDTTFGTGGIVTTPVGSGDAYANVVGIQSDGSILTAGKSFNGSHYDFTLVRYNTNGSPDTSFGTDGIVTTPIGSNDSYAIALGIQSDGNILAAGSSDNGSNINFALVSYLP